MATRVQLTINVGAGAPIEDVRKLIDDLDTVCQFGGELHYRSAIANAELAVLRRPQQWIPGRYFDDLFVAAETVQIGVAVPRGQLGPELLARGVSRYLAQHDPSRGTATTVESLRYANPIEVILSVGAVVLMTLQIIRDWPARRRLNAAVAYETESTVAARKEFRDELTRRLRDGEVLLTLASVEDLLSLDVAGAVQALGRSQLELRELPAAHEVDDVSDGGEEEEE